MTNARLVVFATIAGLFAWVFADALFGSGVFVFRDAGHFYYPLFEFAKHEWAAGRVPLWNPFENLGTPLAANAAASVFYPGKLIFLLPLGYATAYVWYVMGHVLLAAWAAYRLARDWGASTTAAGVAALSYAFSGNVLYQVANVIFLVGAAWLPLAVLTMCRMLGTGERGEGREERVEKRGDREEETSPPVAAGGIAVELTTVRQPHRLRWAVAFGVVLAMMVLGGDVQMAYNAGLLAVSYALWRWWTRSPLSLWERVRAVLAVAATSALVALALSAVQVLPSLEFTRLSARAVSDVPRTIYELPPYLTGSRTLPNRPDVRWSDGLTCRRMEQGTHLEHVYHFSVGPWRLAEYLWPNVSGRQFPIHRRWLDVVPAEGRIWVPSLYMGLVPLVLAVATMRFRRRHGRLAWLTWIIVLAVVGSFGWYGLGWLANESRSAAGADMSKPWVVGSPFGGLYWLATVVLPGYIGFRYPAKLLVIAAMGLSVLAAVGWDRAMAGESTRLRRGLLVLVAISLAAVGAFLAIRPYWDGWLAEVRPDVMFGPLDAAGAYCDFLTAFVQTAVVATLFWWLLGRAARGAAWPVVVALGLVAVDLAVANAWLVPCAPADLWQQDSALAVAMEEHGERVQGSGFRVQEEDAENAKCKMQNAEIKTKDGRRDSFAWLPSLDSQLSTLDPSACRVYRRAIWLPPSWRSTSSPDRLAEAARWDRDTLWPKYNLSARIPLADVYGTMSLYDYEAFAARRGPPPLDKDASNKVPDTFFAAYFILRGDERLAGGVRVALGPRGAGIEDVSLWYAPEHLPRAWIVHDVEVLPHERCHITHDDPSCVQIDARLTRPGLVVLSDQFYPGWQLEVETAGGPARRAPVLRTNRVMRGTWLPAGEHRLTYRFRPASFAIGAAISAIAWLVLAVVILFALHKSISGR